MFLQFLFIASAVLTVGGAILVLTTRNIMHSCIFLLTSLLGTAGLYASMSADFVAAAQIMVYVGGVVILMLFAVMLTGGKDFVSKTQSLLGLPPAMGNTCTYSFAGLVVLVFLSTNIKLLTNIFEYSHKFDPGNSFVSTVNRIGHLLVQNHVLAFEISSVLLLGALVGAAIIARPKRN